MLIGVLTGPTIKEALEQMQKALPWVDGVEWRLDLFSSLEMEEVGAAVEQWPKWTVFTFRGASKKTTEQWLTLQPDFFDIDFREGSHWVKEIIEAFSNTKIILSWHDFDKTPDDLEFLFNKMQRIPAYAYKIAAKAHSVVDAFRMLVFVHTHERVIGISMGEEGQASRILGPIVGNVLDYASLGNADPALGQIEVMELCTVYRYRKLRRGDPIYALLGDPVCYSISHTTHNRCLEDFELPGVYLKLRLREKELQTFRLLASTLPFRGFSVTMPLKNAIRGILDVMPKGPINTISIEKGIWIGSNTDGRAVVALLEEHFLLQDKKCLILGAGGAAYAIAMACRMRGAKIAIANRTKESAENIAREVDGEVFSLEELPKEYDVLIQATNVGMSPEEEKMPVSKEAILSSSLVLEVISSPIKTRVVATALDKGCLVISGRELFLAQAAAQFHIWTGRLPDLMPQDRSALLV
ncbi:MAG: type I 3-dehydroquinate dehydratase [Simkania sp.]|nr:type I 3-dehydroquinate dehydratase [Simkania sp.]